MKEQLKAIRDALKHYTQATAQYDDVFIEDGQKAKDALAVLDKLNESPLEWLDSEEVEGAVARDMYTGRKLEAVAVFILVADDWGDLVEEHRLEYMMDAKSAIATIKRIAEGKP